MKRVVLAAVLLAAACDGPSAASSASPAAATTETPAAIAPNGPHRIVVLATSSLRGAFQQLAARYEQDHPGASVEVVAAGGAQLLAAMNDGRPADVVAIGDSSLMSRFAASAHLASGSVHELARSRIAIAVPAGNPRGIRELADLVQPGVRVALGKRSSSIGRYGRWALSHQQLECTPTVEGDDADTVLAAVAGGRADAGIVYTTTFRGAAKAVEQVPIAAEHNQPVLYSIGAARLAKEPVGAAAFVAFAMSANGQQILHEAGFLPIGAKH